MITPSLRSRLRNLPDPVRKSSHFLLWKHEWNEKRQVLVKTPYYASGKRRYGALDAKRDLRKLTSLEGALDAYEGSPGFYDGIGLALTGDGVAAFDIDKCLDAEGEVIPSHAGNYLTQQAEREGAYIEISPSGQGLRILCRSDDPTAYSKNGVEYWGEGRYVTLTGSLWANPKGWRNLTHLRSTLPSRNLDKQRKSNDQEEILVTRRLLEDLEDALREVDSDERELWIRFGHALKTLGDKGKALWMEWSRKSDKFEQVDAEYTWDSLKPNHISYRTVFSEAQENWGWDNPRTRRDKKKGRLAAVEEEDETGDDDQPTTLLDFALDLGNQKLTPTEFVVDGFMPIGVSLVAGAWGAGKTTNLIPLFASVAHLTPSEWDLHPQLRRHIVWVTEAADQTRDTLYSISREKGAGGWGEFKEWFHLVPSCREEPKSLARIVKRTVKELTYTLDNGFAVRPVVVLDTVSANLELENESDNSEVGRAMAQFKEALPGIPVVLVGHISKAALGVGGGGPGLTFPGAGAWEADAVATYFLVHDADIGMRYMVIGKARFSPDFTEVSFGEAGGRELVGTDWGEPQSKTYIHGVPQKSNGEERKQKREELKQAKKTGGGGEGTERQTEILDLVLEMVGDLVPPSFKGISNRTKGRKELIQGALDRLCENGELVQYEIQRNTFPKPYHLVNGVFLPKDVTLDGFVGLVKVGG